MSDETLENRIGTGKEFYRLTRGDVEEIRQFSKLRREQLFNGFKDRLATGEPFSADEVADLQKKKYDITPEELLAFTTAPENEELRQKGEQNRNVYQSALTEKAEDDSFTQMKRKCMPDTKQVGLMKNLTINLLKNSNKLKRKSPTIYKAVEH